MKTIEDTLTSINDVVQGRHTYRGYIIRYEPPPIPIRTADWQFWHEDYDGAPDAHDYRCGFGPSLEDCCRQIDEQIAEEDDDQQRWEYEMQTEAQQRADYHAEEIENDLGPRARDEKYDEWSEDDD